VFVPELVDAGYVRVDPEHGNRPVALNPEDVARRRLETELREAAARVARLSALPALTDQLAVQYERVRWRSSSGSEYIDDPAVVNARLEDVVGSAEREILAAQPGGPRTRENVDGAVARDSAALDRGIALRTLYRATVRDHPMTSEYARMMANRTGGRSAEYRTLVAPFERAIIVDRRVAFLSNHLVQGAPEHAAWLVTDRAMVAYIAVEFDAKWRRADPWHGEVRGRGVTIDPAPGPNRIYTTRRQREIMRDMVDGKDQRATAGRLGISVRTVSDEINALKDLFDAQSREQLCFKWAFSPDRMVDDSAPEDGLTPVTETAA
jgi:DNA-binding CsgD family transcriptional regulator/sugar-specific transcriptional regulator TrmB